MGFRIVQHPNGTASVQDLASGEAMHSVIGAWEEALLLYVEQSRLAQRFTEPGPEGANAPVTVLDVGMGIAANALCALECRASNPGPRPLRLLSFENDLGGLKLALQNPGSFPFLERNRAKVETLLERGEWRSQDGQIEWKLHTGDFFAHASPELEPEIVFYDFYAPRSCPELWSVESLTRVRALAARREARGLAMDLYTYSAGTPIRVALVLAGFRVGYGTRTPSKAETTVCSTDPARIGRPLGPEWLAKLERSDRPFPWLWPEALRDRAKLSELLLQAPQFSTPG